MSAEGPYSLIEETVPGQRKGRPRNMDGYRTEQNRARIFIYTQNMLTRCAPFDYFTTGAEFSVPGAVVPMNLCSLCRFRSMNV